MNLYEITNGYTGCSYVRAYAWAKDVERAMALFKERNGDFPKLEVRLLMRGDSAPFVTKASDEGWERIEL